VYAAGLGPYQQQVHPMSRKSDPQDEPKDATRGAKSRQSSPQRSITESLPPELPDEADEWFVTEVGGNVEQLSRDLVLGARGQSLRHLPIDKVLTYLARRATASRTRRYRPRTDMAVWKGPRICAYLHEEAAGDFTVYKIN
jgi:hypothetical protein